MEKKLRSLVSLLDETDENIYTQIYEELMKIAVNSPKEYLDFLHKHPGEKIRRELENIWLQTYAEELAYWRKKEFGKDLLKGWFLISRLLKDAMDAQKIYDAVNRLTNLLWLRSQTARNSEEKVGNLYRLLIDEGFSLNEECAIFLVPSCLRLQNVFKEKRIGGIAFVMLFQIVLRKMNVDSHIIKALPYTFGLRLRSRDEEFYLLPYDELIFSEKNNNLSTAALEKMKKAKPYSNTFVILQIIEDLIAYYSTLPDGEKDIIYWKKVRKIIEVPRKNI